MGGPGGRGSRAGGLLLAFAALLPGCGREPSPAPTSAAPAAVPGAAIPALVAAMNRGLGHMDRFDNGAAARELRAAVAAAPGFYPARLDLGLALTNLREDPAGAEEALRAAAALEPAEPSPPFLLGFLLARAQRLPRMEEAAEAFRRAVALAPGDPDAHLGLGVALVETDRLGEGTRELEEAVRLAPRLGAAIYQRAMAWRRAGREEEGRAELLRYADLAKGRLVDVREEVHGYEGRLAEPVRDFARWLPPAPPPEPARTSFVRVEGAFGDGPAPVDPGAALALGDLDGDGTLDLVLGGRTPGWRRGLGECRFGPLVPFPAGEGPAGDLALGDLDGDGRLDVAIAGVGLVRAAGTAPRLEVDPSRGEPGPRRFADVDGDGFLDLVAGRRVWRNDGTGALLPAPGPELPPEPAAAQGLLALGDVDADGLEDAVVRTPAGGAALVRGAPAGAPRAREEVLTTDPAAAAVLADLDGDGDLDLVLAAGGRLQVFRNDGDAGPRVLVLSLKGVFSPQGPRYGRTNARGIGTEVTVSAGRRCLVRRMGADPAPTGKPPPDILRFAVGPGGKADLVSLRWPDGVLQGEVDLPAGRATIEERQRKTNW